MKELFGDSVADLKIGLAHLVKKKSVQALMHDIIINDVAPNSICHKLRCSTVDDLEVCYTSAEWGRAVKAAADLTDKSYQQFRNISMPTSQTDTATPLPKYLYSGDNVGRVRFPKLVPALTTVKNEETAQFAKWGFTDLPDCIGCTTSVATVLRNILEDVELLDKIELDEEKTIDIVIGGDGIAHRNASKFRNLIHITMTLLNFGRLANTQRFQYLIALFESEETYDALQRHAGPVFREIDELASTGLHIGAVQYRINVHFRGDQKWTNLILGLGTAISDTCFLCTRHKDDDFMAAAPKRQLTEMTRNPSRMPLVRSVDISHHHVDILHAKMSIGRQIVKMLRDRAYGYDTNELSLDDDLDDGAEDNIESAGDSRTDNDGAVEFDDTDIDLDDVEFDIDDQSHVPEIVLEKVLMEPIAKRQRLNEKRLPQLQDLFDQYNIAIDVTVLKDTYNVMGKHVDVLLATRCINQILKIVPLPRGLPQTLRNLQRAFRIASMWAPSEGDIRWFSENTPVALRSLLQHIPSKANYYHLLGMRAPLINHRLLTSLSC